MSNPLQSHYKGGGGGKKKKRVRPPAGQTRSTNAEPSISSGKFPPAYPSCRAIAQPGARIKPEPSYYWPNSPRKGKYGGTAHHPAGEDASLGSIAAADVVSLLTGIEKAIVRAAEVRQGRTGGQAGRRNAEREAATRLTLRALEPGSLTVVLDIPWQDTGQDPLFADTK